MKADRIRIGDMLQPFEELLGSRPEPELLTLTEKNGFMAQSAKYNKRVARDDTSDYKVIRKHDIAFNPYLLWAGAIAQNVDWELGLISPLYPTFHIRAVTIPALSITSLEANRYAFATTRFHSAVFQESAARR